MFILQTKCFICGIGNDYFDTVPHGFETHTLQEHNLANYLWVHMELEFLCTTNTRLTVTELWKTLWKAKLNRFTIINMQ